MNLLDILVYRRPHGSPSEAAFINDLLLPAIIDLGYVPELDECGNVWVETASKAAAPYLFVAHIDTCHRQTGMLKPIIRGSIVSVHEKDKDSGCLGADDAVGMYSNYMMMKAGVKGTYLFTRGEERGGIGASYIARETPEKLEGFLMSVEVDRAGKEEIIVSQASGDCASEDFAIALGKAIGMGHEPSDLGVYTDVDEFGGIIPENVNIAAGYYNQHTLNETVDLDYVNALIAKLIRIDWSSMPIKREAGDFGDLGGVGMYSGYGPAGYQTQDNYNDHLLDFITDNPVLVADYLDHLGVEVYEMEDYDKSWKTA